MPWTTPQIITSSVSVTALTISLANFVLGRLSARKESSRRKRDDLLHLDQLLDDAFVLLYGKDGYSSTKDATKLLDAEICVSKALKIGPEHPRAIEYEGHLFEVQGNRELARQRYEKSISLDNTRARAHNCLGSISDGGKAISHFEAAIKLEPEKAALPYCNLGRAYNAQSLWAKAERCFRKAIERRPMYAHAHHELAQLLKRQGEPEEAIREYELAIAADSNYVSAMVNLGALLKEHAGREEDGIAWIEHAIKVNPSDDYPLAMLAAIYADRKQPERALAYAQQAMAIDPSRRFAGDSFDELRKEMHALLDSEAQKNEIQVSNEGPLNSGGD